MATRVNTQAAQAPLSQPTLVCDYCGMKPRYQNHTYCSKTCANQAAALCAQCHQKPKYQNFEYCGKSCASIANAGKSHPVNGAAAVAPPATTNTQPQAAQNGHGKGSGTRGGAQKGPKPAMNQLAQMISQVPQALMATMNGNSIPAGQTNAVSAAAAGPMTQGAQVGPQTIGNGSTGPVPATLNPVPPASSNNNPFSNGTFAIPQSQGQGSAAAVANGSTLPTVPNQNGGQIAQPNALLLSTTQQPPNDTICLIPGCGKPVHVDADGIKASNFCSRRHREEAVSSGLVQPCIMCLSLPQGNADYFCSRACKEDALHKQ